MPSRRVRFRPPGIKPWTRIGTLGPFRSRLGLAWVIAPLVVGVVLVVAVWLLLFRSAAPGSPFVPVGTLESFADGAARQVEPLGIWVGRASGQVFAVGAAVDCTLSFCNGRYTDCRDADYGLDGRATSGDGRLDVYPIKVHRGTVYVDPQHPVKGTPGSPLPGIPENPC